MRQGFHTYHCPNIPTFTFKNNYNTGHSQKTSIIRENYICKFKTVLLAEDTAPPARGREREVSEALDAKHRIQKHASNSVQGS